MKNFVTFVSILVINIWHPTAFADYKLGCGDPEYHQYIEQRFTYFEASNRRMARETLRNYNNSLQTSTNPYRIISDLSRHLKYSAQFDSLEDVQLKINQLLAHGDNLRVDQQIAGSIFDNFSNENHSLGIARAWLAYRQGDTKVAFEELLASIEIGDSAVMSSFGPDINLIRYLYYDGHVEPVLAYLTQTEAFWTGREANNLRYIWRAMIKANCKVQFQSFDTIKALELGLSVRDVSKDYGVGW
jgi:hypothetical protein